MENQNNLNMLKNEFREFCSSYLVLRTIDDIFSSAGFSEEKTDRNISSERRRKIESYYSSIDWQAHSSEKKLMLVIGNLLRSKILTDEERRGELHDMCQKWGFEITEEESENDFFANQFPAGLPFGRWKPDFAVKAKKGGGALAPPFLRLLRCGTLSI